MINFYSSPFFFIYYFKSLYIITCKTGLYIFKKHHLVSAKLRKEHNKRVKSFTMKWGNSGLKWLLYYTTLVFEPRATPFSMGKFLPHIIKPEYIGLVQLKALNILGRQVMQAILVNNQATCRDVLRLPNGVYPLSTNLPDGERLKF